MRRCSLAASSGASPCDLHTRHNQNQSRVGEGIGEGIGDGYRRGYRRGYSLNMNMRQASITTKSHIPSKERVGSIEE